MINVSSMGNYYVRKIQNRSNKEVTYYWTIFAFDKCSVECGIGIQKRKVSCCKRLKHERGNRHRSKCRRVPVSKCSVNHKPPSTQECRSECFPRWDTG